MNKKIMIVDDDRLLLEELRDALLLSDYDVIPVDDPTMVVDEAIANRPDAILMDIRMPDESGFQVAGKLKFFSGLRNIPIIAMTAHFKKDYTPLMKAYGIKNLLRKPFDPVDMVSRLEDALD